MNNLQDWQDSVIPANMLKFRLDKKEGLVCINGIEIKHIPTANEIVEICTLETKNRRFYRWLSINKTH